MRFHTCNYQNDDPSKDRNLKLQEIDSGYLPLNMICHGGQQNCTSENRCIGIADKGWR